MTNNSNNNIFWRGEFDNTNFEWDIYIVHSKAQKGTTMKK